MEPILAKLEAEFIGKTVRVEFTKIDGVIAHTIFLVNGEEKTPALTSQINAPNLPCFTELHQQGDMLFLTGVDGPCHWSMSVAVGEILPTGSKSRAGETDKLLEQRYRLNTPQNFKNPFDHFLHFDIACRLKEPLSDLRNEYTAIGGFGCSRTISACSALDCMNMNLGMICFGGPTEGIAFSSQTQYSMDCVSDREISFAPLDAKVSTFPATLRWSYGVWRVM